MFARLLSLRGQVSFPLLESPDDAVGRLLAQFKFRLAQERAQGILQTGHILHFHGGYLWFSAPSWYLLAAFDSGEVRVFTREDCLVVSYRLSFLQQVVWALLLGIAAWFLHQNRLWVVDVWAGFVLLFILDYVIAFLGFDQFTRSMWEDIYAKKNH